MDYVHSRANPFVKHLIKLATQRRERLRSSQSVLVGTHLVESALDHAFTLQHVFVRDGSSQHEEVARLIERCNAARIRMTTLSGELFDAIEQMPSHTGILALFEFPRVEDFNASRGAVLLENVQDPGNVGSVLRTTAASTVGQVWLTKGCADVWSPKVLRAAMGAHFLLDIIEGVEIADLPDAPIAVTTLKPGAKSLYETAFPRDIVLALGAEGAGVSEELLAKATHPLHIPMSGRVESLNVAAAAAICIFERERQLLSAAE